MAAILSIFDAHKRLLDNATKDDETPTPGYMYNEINKITFESYDQSNKVLEHLLLRLKKNMSAAVKLKVLIVMKSIVQKGNPQFRRELQRKSEEIRECLYFKGPPDPLRGDTPYKVVRDQAQVVLNMLFDTETNETISTASMGSIASPQVENGSNKLSNVGSTMTPSIHNGPTFGHRGPTSMGNVMYEKKEPTLLEKMKTGIANLTARKQQPSYDHSAPLATYGKIANMSEPTFQEYTGPIEPNKPLGGWDDPNDVRTRVNVNSPLPRTVHAPVPVNNPVEESQASTGEKEMRLVEELTQPTGVRAVPSTVELNQFVRTCQSGNLDLFTVYTSLVEKLTSNRWQARLKSLHAIEMLLKSEVDNAADYFAGHVHVLEEQLSSLQKSVTDKTQQVLALIQPTVQAQSSDSAFNFINGDGAQESSSGSIFEGLNTADDESNATLFSGLSLSESSAKADNHVTRSNGPELISFTETHARTSVSAPTSPAPPRTNNADLDLLSGIDFNARPATTPVVQQQPIVQQPHMVQVQYVQYGQTVVPMMASPVPVYTSVPVTPAVNQLPSMQVAPSPFAAAPYEQPQLPVVNAQLYSGPSVYNTQALKKKAGQSSESGFGFVHSEEDSFDFVQDEIQAMKAKNTAK